MHKSYEARSTSYLALYSKHKRRSAPQCLCLYKITVRYIKRFRTYLKLTSEISIWTYAIANGVRILSCATRDLFQILSKAIFIQDCMWKLVQRFVDRNDFWVTSVNLGGPVASHNGWRYTSVGKVKTLHVSVFKRLWMGAVLCCDVWWNSTHRGSCL